MIIALPLSAHQVTGMARVWKTTETSSRKSVAVLIKLLLTDSPPVTETDERGVNGRTFVCRRHAKAPICTHGDTLWLVVGVVRSGGSAVCSREKTEHHRYHTVIPPPACLLLGGMLHETAGSRCMQPPFVSFTISA